MSPSKETIFTRITSLKLYLQDAATTVSWSDVSWKEGMVGVAVVDISSSWTVNLPFTNPPELFGLSAGALILQIRKGNCPPVARLHRALSPGQAGSPHALCKVGISNSLHSVKHATQRLRAHDGALTPSPKRAWRRCGLEPDSSIGFVYGLTDTDWKQQQRTGTQTHYLG